jgi:hypothetical protein
MTQKNKDNLKNSFLASAGRKKIFDPSASIDNHPVCTLDPIFTANMSLPWRWGPIVTFSHGFRGNSPSCHKEQAKISKMENI